MLTPNRKAIYPKIILFLILIGFIALVLSVFGKPKAQREDFKRILSQEYNTVFLSMYPVDTYQEEDFSHYFGMSVFKASYCIPKLSVMEQYMKQISKSGYTVTTAYLGIRPDKTNIRDLQDFITQYPSISFEILLAYPSLDYWAGLSEQEYERTLADYSSFLLEAPYLSNAHFFFHGSREWLIANPGNYESEWLVNESIAMTILCESTIFNDYYVVPENAASHFQALADLTQQARTAPDVFPDLSDYAIVFFGDSVIGNYTDSASIPGVVSGLTKATVYNCGQGGTCASATPGSNMNLPGFTAAFLQGDVSALPGDTQVYQGLSSYLADDAPDENLCFILNFGLNDYFDGYAISSEADPYDTATFCGAIRTSVDMIRSHFPDAQIILCTPSYCYLFQEGTEPHGEGQHLLTEYVDAILSLSRELRVDVLDTYHAFGINGSNWNSYLLSDQVHPNAAYRYWTGRAIGMLIR